MIKISWTQRGRPFDRARLDKAFDRAARALLEKFLQSKVDDIRESESGQGVKVLVTTNADGATEILLSGPQSILAEASKRIASLKADAGGDTPV